MIKTQKKIPRLNEKGLLLHIICIKPIKFMSMKKILAIALLVICCGWNYSQAQSFGVKAGFNLSTMTHDGNGSNVKHPYQPGFTAGIFGEYDFTDMFGLSAEVLYSMQGYKSNAESANYKKTVLTHMLKVPVLFNINLLDERLNIQAGPQFGFILAERIKNSDWDGNNKTDDKVDKDGSPYGYNMFDLALAVGANFYITENLFAGARYELGFTDTQKQYKFSSNSVENFNSKFNVITLMVGYRF